MSGLFRFVDGTLSFVFVALVVLVIVAVALRSVMIDPLNCLSGASEKPQVAAPSGCR